MHGLSRLPLPLLHILGAGFGRAVYYLSRSFRQRLLSNMQGSGLFSTTESDKKLTGTLAAAELGKLVAETPAIWLRSPDKILSWVQNVSGWETVCQLKKTHPIIFLTPHLGAFELAGFWLAQRLPITILYRPSKLAWLEPYFRQGRERGQACLATANLRGVRSALKTLKKGESVGLLPDQVPQEGEGVWASFFGRAAYTMTLVGRLQQASQAIVVLVVAQRLRLGHGFNLSFSPLEKLLSTDSHLAATQLNQALEMLIRQYPTQYLWSYNRYKTPRGAMPPSTNPLSKS